MGFFFFVLVFSGYSQLRAMKYFCLNGKELALARELIGNQRGTCSDCVFSILRYSAGPSKFGVAGVTGDPAKAQKRLAHKDITHQPFDCTSQPPHQMPTTQNKPQVYIKLDLNIVFLFYKIRRRKNKEKIRDIKTKWLGAGLYACYVYSIFIQGTIQCT